jgi:hypothetical protein
LPYTLEALGRANIFPYTIEQGGCDLAFVGGRSQKWRERAAARRKSVKKLRPVKRDAAECVLRLLVVGQKTIIQVEITA